MQPRFYNTAQNVGSLLMPPDAGRVRSGLPPAQRALSTMFGVLPRAVTARQVLRAGCAGLLEAVALGEVTLTIAVQIARFSPDDQRTILAGLRSMTRRQRADFVRMLSESEVQR